MKTSKSLDVYTCDNPACAKVVRHDPEADGLERPDGYHGTVILVLAPASLEREFFACKLPCLRAAQIAVLNGGVDEKIAEGVASVEEGRVYPQPPFVEGTP